MSRDGLLQRYPRFHIGERVVMTHKGIEAGLLGRARSRVGLVLGCSRERVKRMSVTVERDGIKTASQYHSSFWRHLRATDAKRGIA